MLTYRERQRIIEAQKLRPEASGAKEERSSRLWKFFNSPFGLWVLGTLSLSALTATFSELQTCAKEQETNSLEFERLSDELYGRNKLLYDRLGTATDAAEYYTEIDKFKSGTGYYIFSDYKARSLQEISLRRFHISKKLDLVWDPPYSLVKCNEVTLARTPRGRNVPGSSRCRTVRDGPPSITVELAPRGDSSASNPALPYIDVFVPDACIDSPGCNFERNRDAAIKISFALATPRAYADKGEYWRVQNRCSLVKIWSRLLGLDARRDPPRYPASEQ